MVNPSETFKKELIFPCKFVTSLLFLCVSIIFRRHPFIRSQTSVSLGTYTQIAGITSFLFTEGLSKMEEKKNRKM